MDDCISVLSFRSIYRFRFSYEVIFELNLDNISSLFMSRVEIYIFSNFYIRGDFRILC